jgi:hypothetical protein
MESSAAAAEEDVETEAANQIRSVLSDVEDVIGRIRALQRRYSRDEIDRETYHRLLQQYQAEKKRAAAALDTIRSQLPDTAQTRFQRIELRILAEDLKNLAERLEFRGANTYPEVVKLDHVIDQIEDIGVEAASNELSIIEDTLLEKQEALETDQPGEGNPFTGGTTEEPSEREDAAAEQSDTGEHDGEQITAAAADAASLIAEIEAGINRLKEKHVPADAFTMRLDELNERYENGEHVAVELDELKKHVEDRELYEELKQLDK